MYYIDKVKKLNMDVYQVVFSGVVVAEFMSEAAATSYMLANRFKINARQLEEQKAKQEETLHLKRRKVRNRILKHRTSSDEVKQSSQMGALEPALVESAALDVTGQALTMIDEALKKNQTLPKFKKAK